MSERTVLHVIDAFDIGGAQELLVLMARRLPPGWRMAVCILQPLEGMRPRLEAEGALVYGLGLDRPSMRRPWEVFTYMRSAIGSIMDLCRELKVDVVHCHLSDAEFVAIPAGRLARVRKVVSTVHTPTLLPDRNLADPRNMLRILVMHFLYRFTDHVVAVSSQTEHFLRNHYGLTPPRLSSLPNGVDLGKLPDRDEGRAIRASLGIGESERLILSVGRLIPQKGQDTLVDAFGMLAGRYPDLRLLIAGDGPLREELGARIDALGLNGRILLLGGRDDVPGLLAASDLTAFPSRYEGTSLALMEAMATGLPLVATDTEGNLEVLKGVPDALSPVNDAEALAANISRVLDDPRYAESLGRQVREAVSYFDINRVIAQYQELWT